MAQTFADNLRVNVFPVPIDLEETAAEAVATRTLVCRGGPGLAVVIYGENVRFRMSKRTDRAATLGLAPGECAWIDGGLTENDPIDFYFAPIPQQPIVATSFEGSSPVSMRVMEPDYEWLNDLRSLDHQIAFDVSWQPYGATVSNPRRVTPPYPML